MNQRKSEATSEAAETRSDSQINFNSKALNGLRGLAALHICVHHSLYYSESGINTYGQVHMPMFMILSGFCLTLSYGKKNFNRSTVCCGKCQYETGCKCSECSKSEEAVFDSWSFYVNRMTRLLPVYYATFIFGLPLISAGHSYFGPFDWHHNVGGAFLAFFGVQTWVIALGFGPDGPSWFVSTVFFFYIVFPRLLVFAQRQCNQKLGVWMAVAFYFEITVLTIIMISSPDEKGYWLATAHPFSRLPVFFTGVCAGVLCIRVQNGDLSALNAFGKRSQNWFLSFWEDNFFPWPFCGKTESDKNEIADLSAKQRSSWTRRVNVNSFYYFGMLLTLTLLHILYTVHYNYGVHVIAGKNELMGHGDIDKMIFFDTTIFGLVLQATAVYTQLTIAVGLCFDGSQSIASKFFNSRIMQFAGRISMALYLSHELVIYWINWIIYGTFNWPMHRVIRQPMWAIPIHILISLVIGILLTWFFEDPMRRWLKQQGKEKRNWAIFFTAVVSTMAIVGTTFGVLFHGGNVLSEHNFTIDGQTYFHPKILSGTSREIAQQLCEDKGMSLFEPKDSTINYRIWEKMSRLTNYPYWINIFRDNPNSIQFKYGSNDKNITWANWQENEPNNYGGQDENCVGTNLVQYKWRYKWFDVNCNSHLAVVCQKNQDTPISEDVELKMNNMTYVFKPSQSGNFEESSMVCEAENMSLLEVRDKISYEAVKKQALATGQDVIWLNIRRLNIAKKASERTDPQFVYYSNNETVIWTDFPPNKPGPPENGEDCVQITQVQWSGDWQFIWNDVNCDTNGQIVCQIPRKN